jgi:hypothetical protein
VLHGNDTFRWIESGQGLFNDHEALLMPSSTRGTYAVLATARVAGQEARAQVIELPSVNQLDGASVDKLGGDGYVTTLDATGVGSFQFDSTDPRPFAMAARCAAPSNERVRFEIADDDSVMSISSDAELGPNPQSVAYVAQPSTGHRRVLVFGVPNAPCTFLVRHPAPNDELTLGTQTKTFPATETLAIYPQTIRADVFMQATSRTGAFPSVVCSGRTKPVADTSANRLFAILHQTEQCALLLEPPGTANPSSVDVTLSQLVLAGTE